MSDDEAIAPPPMPPFSASGAPTNEAAVTPVNATMM
jgi:hypothetical protein